MHLPKGFAYGKIISMNGAKALRIFLNILTLIAVWLFIAGFVNIINVVNAENLYRRGYEVEGVIESYYTRSSGSSSGGSMGGYSVHFICSYTDPETSEVYKAETSSEPHQYSPDEAKAIGEKYNGKKITMVIYNGLCSAQRDVEWNYISSVLITTLFIVCSSAYLTGYGIYEGIRLKRKKAIREAEENASDEAVLY